MCTVKLHSEVMPLPTYLDITRISKTHHFWHLHILRSCSHAQGVLSSLFSTSIFLLTIQAVAQFRKHSHLWLLSLTLYFILSASFSVLSVPVFLSYIPAIVNILQTFVSVFAHAIPCVYNYFLARSFVTLPITL